MSEKKWSNPLNRPWYFLDENGDVNDMEGNLVRGITLVEHLNEATEKACVNASIIKELEKDDHEASYIKGKKYVINYLKRFIRDNEDL